MRDDGIGGLPAALDREDALRLTRTAVTVSPLWGIPRVHDAIEDAHLAAARVDVGALALRVKGLPHLVLLSVPVEDLLRDPPGLLRGAEPDDGELEPVRVDVRRRDQHADAVGHLGL